jgi:hypothetical protein
VVQPNKELAMDKYNTSNSDMKTATTGSDRKESTSHKLGDKIERLGEKIKDAGATKIGQAVYDAGNKLEHSQDKKQR